MIESINLATMGIADKVNRYLQAHYYTIQLAALQKSVQTIGGAFVQQAHASYLPPEVEEHLAFAVMLARESYLSPKAPTVDHYRAVERGLEDGYAVVLLREIFSALDALGLRLHVRPEGYDLEALRAERLEWKAMEVWPPLASLTNEIDIGVTQLLEQFGFGESKNEHDHKDKD